MNHRKNFNYTYTLANQEVKIAGLKEVRFIPSIRFDVVCGNQIIPCHLYYSLDEWYILFLGTSKKASLSDLDDTFWNWESICSVLGNDELSLAISKAIYELYREYQNILS